MKGNGKAKHRRGTASRRFVRQWYGSALHSKGVALSREAGQGTSTAPFREVLAKKAYPRAAHIYPRGVFCEGKAMRR